jgi:hypothetical protein
MTAPRLPLLLGLLAALFLGACGDNPEALNSQGYRAMRFDAFEDAYWFFHYSEEMLTEQQEAYPEDHPERLRLTVGQLALELREHPERSAARLAEELPGLTGIPQAEAEFLADQLRRAERGDLADRFLVWADHESSLESGARWLADFDPEAWAAGLAPAPPSAE